jgi:hypothetical protein
VATFHFDLPISERKRQRSRQRRNMSHSAPTAASGRCTHGLFWSENDSLCTRNASTPILPSSSRSGRRARHKTSRPTAAPTTVSLAPSSAPSHAAKETEKSGGLGWLTMSFLVIVGALVLWRLWIRYQRQMELRMLDFRSKQADRVLGDMQMVPNEDLDNELL